MEKSTPSTRPRASLDGDLEKMTRENLVAEIKKLRAGIREHRDADLHDLCWHHPRLWGLLPEKSDPLPTVPEWPRFLEGCIRYRKSLDAQLKAAPRSKSPYLDRMNPEEPHQHE